MLRAEDLWRIELEGLIGGFDRGCAALSCNEEEYFPPDVRCSTGLIVRSRTARSTKPPEPFGEARAHEARDEGGFPSERRAPRTQTIIST